MSETAKHRHLTAPYCQGAGLDLASGGDPVVPWAIQVELPEEEAIAYGTTDFGIWPIQLRGDARNLWWFRDGTLDFVYASHLLEDFPAPQWPYILSEWLRVLKPGGHLVILVPERLRWQNALAAGQTPNCRHVYEPLLGEVSKCLAGMDEVEVLIEELADAEDYSILCVARKTA